MSDARWDRFHRETWLALRKRDRQQMTRWGRWWHGRRMRQFRQDAWWAFQGVVAGVVIAVTAGLLWVLLALLVAPLPGR